MFTKTSFGSHIPGIGYIIKVIGLCAGTVTTAVIPTSLITVDQIRAYCAGALVQDAFPKLNASEREFITTGMTAEQQEKLYGSPAVVRFALVVCKENTSS